MKIELPTCCERTFIDLTKRDAFIPGGGQVQCICGNRFGMLESNKLIGELKEKYPG